MLSYHKSFLVGACLVASSFGFNFPYEAAQLQDSDVADNPDLAFGELPGGIAAECKTFPGDQQWPSAQRWNALNVSLGGALIQKPPPAAACYDGPFRDAATCDEYKRQAGSSLYA